MGDIITFARDTLTNLVSRMGTDRDKGAASFYGRSVLDDGQIANAYAGAWLPRKIVDVPAFDSVRVWRDWQAKPDQIEAIEAEELRLNLKAKVFEARTKARLFGGAAIMIGTGDVVLDKPLKPEGIGKDGLKYLTVLSCRDLAGGEIERDPTSEWYGKPKYYTLSNANGQSLKIDPSRLAIFMGAQIADPSLSPPTHSGWGDSCLQAVLDAVKQADNTAANIATLVFEAKIDIIRVPDFMKNLGDNAYREKILQRYTLANTAKGINGTLMLDKEEEYESKSTSFATLPDVLDRFLQIVSGAADIPATRLLGQAPAGMNATGESDTRNYYDRISSMQQIEMTPGMARLDECLVRSALGSAPPEVHYNWAPLWGMSEKEKADVFKTKADAARTIAGTGGASPSLMPIDALSDALVNELIEDGSLSGLESAIEEYGKLSEQEDDPTDLEAAVTPTTPEAVAANDAAPRSLYVRRDVLNAGDIIAWAKGQGFDTTLPADDMHVTITYSRAPVDWIAMGENWSGDDKGNLTINAGGPRMMEQFGKATVLLFASSSLSWRHESMMRNGASWDHEEYQPHITISYDFDGDISKIEPYRGVIKLGPEIFEEIKDDWQAGITEE
ncbi:MAG: DUF1073 domain-containing protein [Asticcacaulis sp.]|uniref:anti-CBASS protein Acb1 family protein n=1 Tax=Asticcacaulis sp. TaxID=1872648 RepID=UPI0039E32BAC